MFLKEIVDLYNTYDFSSKKNKDFNIITYYFKTDEGFNFSVDFGGDSKGNWDRNFLTKEKQFGTDEKFKILNTITKITLDFIEKYKPKKISIYHARSVKELNNNPTDENKRTRVNKYFLEKVLPSNYKIKTFGNNTEIDLVENKLNLKSRAPEQEKQRDEYINKIFNKNLNEITTKDIDLLINISKGSENLNNIITKFIKEKIITPLLDLLPNSKNIYFDLDELFLITNKKYRIFYDGYDFVLENIKVRYGKQRKYFYFKTLGELITYIKEKNIDNLNELKKPINEIAELTNTYSYEKIVDGDKIKYRFSDGEEIFFVKFLLLLIGKFGEEWEREYYTTSKWMDELNKENSLRILGTVTKITNEFINDYKPGIITISHIDSRKETMGRFSIDSILSGNKKENNEPNKRAKINRLFLSKNLPEDYKLEYKGNITFIKRKDLNEGLSDKIKSRAPEQEKQRNDYIKSIIGDKSIMDLKPKEVVEVEKIDEHFMDKFIINRIKQKFPNLKHDDNFIYITYDNKPSHITIFVSTRNYFVLRCFDNKKIGTTGLLLDEKFYSVGELCNRLEEIILQNYIP